MGGVAILMFTYKLFRKRKDGSLSSLFTNKSVILPEKKWLKAKTFPTKGFAVRHGWHTLLRRKAPHLSKKGRVWKMVQVKYYKRIERPASQGGTWIIAEYIKIL